MTSHFPHTSLYSDTSQILLSILSHLSTSNLFSLLPVNRRIYCAAITILHDRLLRAAAMPEHRLTLECYTPDERLTAPSFYCDYLATDPLPTPEALVTSLSQLNGLYSHFKPTYSAQEGRRRWSDTAEPESTVLGSGTMHLDESALFGQLCTVTNLVKLGPRRGLFLSHVNVGEGVIRVWRDWLASRAAAGVSDGGEVLWADADRDVGIRVGLVEPIDAADSNAPVFVARDEDLPVSYRLEYSEVLVRSTKLLRMLEKSETQEMTDSGRAIVLAL